MKNDNRLIVNDLDKLEIYKMTRWNVYFKYNNNKFMFHSSSDGYDETTYFYSKFENGRLNEIIKSGYGDYCSKAYHLKKKESMPYKYINKKEFCDIFKDFIKLEI